MEKTVTASTPHVVTLDENNLTVYRVPSIYEGGIKVFHEL